MQADAARAPALYPPRSRDRHRPHAKRERPSRGARTRWRAEAQAPRAETLKARTSDAVARTQRHSDRGGRSGAAEEEEGGRTEGRTDGRTDEIVAAGRAGLQEASPASPQSAASLGRSRSVHRGLSVARSLSGAAPGRSFGLRESGAPALSQATFAHRWPFGRSLPRGFQPPPRPRSPARTPDATRSISSSIRSR